MASCPIREKDTALYLELVASSKGLAFQIAKIGRKIFGKPLRELSRTGRIIQTLWDASQLLAQQRRHLMRIGEITLKLLRDGKISNIGVERLGSKIDQIDRLLKRQENILRGYQKRSDIRELLGSESDATGDRRDPTQEIQI